MHLGSHKRLGLSEISSPPIHTAFLQAPSGKTDCSLGSCCPVYMQKRKYMKWLEVPRKERLAIVLSASGNCICKTVSESRIYSILKQSTVSPSHLWKETRYASHPGTEECFLQTETNAVLVSDWHASELIVNC